MGERSSRDEDRRAFRRALVRVLVTQVVAVLLLWVLHARYHG